MLRVFDPATKKLQPSEKLPERGWAHLSCPSEEEIKRLNERGVLDHLIEHATDVDEIARVYHQKNSSLIIMRAPQNPGEHPELPYRTEVIGVVLVDDLIVTICQNHSEIIEMLASTEDLSIEKPVSFVLQLIMQIAERFLWHVRTIDKIMSGLENKFKNSLGNQEVIELLKYQKGLVYFTTALSSNRIMLERLAKDTHLSLSPEDHELLEDTLVEVHQAIAMVGISGDILSRMVDSFASIIANNLNVVMKALTALTLVLTVPLLLVGVYGMNIPLPGQDNPYALHVIVAGSLAFTLLTSLIFWRRRWL